MTHEKPEGRLIFWFGAGLSIAGGMPSGFGLTRQWLEHHLPDGEAEAILDLFEQNQELIDKSFPRLEKVIEDAHWTFGAACLENLRFFDDCRPNAQHRAIADYIADNRLYAFTTNFDTAIEDFRSGEMPVITPTTGVTADWGLVKLHGSMEEDLAALGHSITNLQAGLSPAFRDLLRELLDDPANTFVFCGYSGSDYFDVTPFFKERANWQVPFAARVIWLHHVNDPPGGADADRDWSDDDWGEQLSTGADAILAAFDPDRKQRRAGDTRALLAELIDMPDFPDPIPAQPWWEGWPDRFSPDADGKALYAAKLHASFGFGRRSAAFIDASALAVDVFDRRHQLWCNALRDQGHYEAELLLRRRAARQVSPEYSPEFHARQLAVTLRLSGRLIAAGLLYLRLLQRYADHERFMISDRFQALWTVAEAGLFAQTILAGLPRGWAFRRCLLPVEVPLRLMVGRALTVFQRQAPSCEQADDPHLQMTVTRISNFLADDPGAVIAWIERQIYRDDGSPVLIFHDDTPDRYRETDSLLGLVNYKRHHASQALNAVEWNWRGRAKNKKDDKGEYFTDGDRLDEAVFSLKSSFRIARIIDDPVGEIKALRGLGDIARRRGHQRMAIGWRRWADKIRRRHAVEAAAALWAVKAWIAATGKAARR